LNEIGMEGRQIRRPEAGSSSDFWRIEAQAIVPLIS
jgi:hypothetical protein